MYLGPTGSSCPYCGRDPHEGACCVFCRRVENHEYDVTAVDSVVMFEPLDPVVPGHMLFIPRYHARDAAENPFAARDCMNAAAAYADRRGLDANIITSIGPFATQTVFHLHLHYVPRREGDGLALPWTGQKKGNQ